MFNLTSSPLPLDGGFVNDDGEMTTVPPPEAQGSEVLTKEIIKDAQETAAATIMSHGLSFAAAVEVAEAAGLYTIPDPQSQDASLDAVVLVDPRLTDCPSVLEAARTRNFMVLAVLPVASKKKSRENSSSMCDFYPSRADLLEAGVHEVYEPPAGEEFDVVRCAESLKGIEELNRWRFRGVIPLREAAVDYSDVLASMIGLTNHNVLSLSTSRRDKGLMKHAVQASGLRIAKFARLTCEHGSDVRPAIEELQLEPPFVVKTPSGYSTMDVYIVDTIDEAELRARQIIGGDGAAFRNKKTVHCALLEEFIGGEEFAVNLVASPHLHKEGDAPPSACPSNSASRVQVTDVWKYTKTRTNGTSRNKWQQMVDPHDPQYAALVEYAEGVCCAVGINYGFAHVELKADYCPATRAWVRPTMIEVGARLAGGRKAIMAENTVPGWKPFAAMLEAHCGLPVRLPRSFSPLLSARHVFLPSEKTGTIVDIAGANLERLSTYNSHLLLRDVGSKVMKATDIMSFVGFVWLVGTPNQVEEDAVTALREFVVDVKEDEQ